MPRSTWFSTPTSGPTPRHSIRGRRWTIEHGFIPAPDHFDRLRALGVTVTAQNHLFVAAPSLVDYWGAARAALTTPVGLYAAEGIPVSLGTDSPVIPHNPFHVLYHFATRGTLSAGVMGAEHAVTREEALLLMTAGYAYQVFAEAERGTLAPGMAADLAVLSGDYRTVADGRYRRPGVGAHRGERADRPRRAVAARRAPLWRAQV